MQVKDLQNELRSNIRDYGMYIALFVIMAVFAVLTRGVFISSRNIADLMNQTGYIAILAVGVTLVIVMRQTDLSVGFLSGFLGAIGAIAMVSWGWSSCVAIPLLLVLGIIAGLLTGFLVATVGIPAFVATIAGWLIYRGCLLVVTRDTGTIVIQDPLFLAIGSGYVPDLLGRLPILPHVHKLTLLLGLATIAWANLSMARSRRSRAAYHFDVPPTDLFVVKQLFLSLLLAAITWVLAGARGLSWTLVVVLAVVALYDYVTHQTPIGRYIYAVGSNPDAAEASGISVKKMLYLVFASMGLLSAVSGILFASRLQSATPTAGTLFEMDAIAAAYIGGVSAAGGVGKVTGALVGSLVYMSLTSGMNLIGVDISLQYIVRGAVLAAAVIFDVSTRRHPR